MTNELTPSGLLDRARTLLPETIALRRALHRHPEVGLRLPRTQQAVLDAIGDLGLAPRTGTSVSSVVALLAGAARLLAACRQDVAGRVVFMFQPGEEGYHGARFMLDEGLLEHAASGAGPVGGAYALHVSTQYPAGTLNLRAGPMMASGDRLEITVRGRSGHASAPYRALDPVPVACEIVQALQTLITRRVSVFDPAVITIGRIAAGTTHNIIPETAELLGTMRTLSEHNREALRGQVVRIAEGVAAAHGATAEVEIRPGYPVTVNDGDAAELLGGVAAELVGSDRVNFLPDPVMGSEDFSYVLQRVPGAMAFLGACPPGADPEVAPTNHSRQVVFDEDALAVALRHLARQT